MSVNVKKNDIQNNTDFNIIIDQDYYNKLIDQLIKYENQYYSSELTDITDTEFDSLYYEAKSIEQQHKDWIRTDSPTKRIMGSINKNDKEVIHNIPCLSLSKAMDFDELKKWLKNLVNLGINKFFVEPYNGLII